MSFHNFTLLYVEDDTLALSTTLLILEDHFTTIYTATDPLEAIMLYQKHTPDIVLTDIKMPTMDGLSMVTKMRQIHNKNNPVFVAISAMDDRETLLEAMNIGIDFFVPKPLDIDQLLTILQKAQDTLLMRKKEKDLYEAKISQLSVMAYNDPLTNIPNRSHFQNKLQEIFQNHTQNDQYSLMYIDLDNFKSINDTYGHSAGDAILVHFAYTLQEILTPHAIIIARLSGDEFAAILNTTKKEELIAIAQQLLDAVTVPIELDDTTHIHISCSIGITPFNITTTNPHTIVHTTDLAMYEAKKRGKNRFYIQEEGS
jgi:diguanylate cyclase (GGDEF)-like protein